MNHVRCVVNPQRKMISLTKLHPEYIYPPTYLGISVVMMHAPPRLSFSLATTDVVRADRTLLSIDRREGIGVVLGKRSTTVQIHTRAHIYDRGKGAKG